MTDEESPQDIEFEFDAELPPLVPPGDNYTVAFRRAERRWLWGKRVKLFMRFQVVAPAQFAGLPLFMFCNVPPGGKWGIPDLPYFDEPDKYARVEGNFQWKAFYARVLENGVDASHTPFVHRGSFGNPEQPEIEDYVVETPNENSARATIHLTPQRSRGLWGRLYRREPAPVKTVVQ